jgi:recombination protein RecT
MTQQRATGQTLVAATTERAPLSPAQRQMNEIGRQLETFSAPIRRLLSSTGVSDDTFKAQIVNAVRATPTLLGCNPETVIGAALRCAQLGLAPNDVRNLAWIIPRKTEATFQMGYGGVMELARRATPGLKFDGRPVYPGDEFDLDYGKAEPLTHKPAVVFQRARGGDAYAWYVRARFPDGTVQVHVLDVEGVEYHRGFSKRPNDGMWADSYDAAALKSVVLDMKRWLPMSTELAVGLASDDTVIDVRRVEPLEATSTIVEPPAPAELDPVIDPDDGFDPDEVGNPAEVVKGGA